MTFRTLLPALSQAHNQSGHHPEALIDADEPGDAYFQVRARMLHKTDGGLLLRIYLWSRHLGYGTIVITDEGDLAALEVAERDTDAWTAAEAVLAHKGHRLDGGFDTMFSPKVGDEWTRRSARLFVGDGSDAEAPQVSAKLLEFADDDETVLLQLRVRAGSTGWLEFILNEEFDLVAQTVGLTEKDAWKAAQAVLRRKGYAL